MISVTVVEPNSGPTDASGAAMTTPAQPFIPSPAPPPGAVAHENVVASLADPAAPAAVAPADNGFAALESFLTDQAPAAAAQAPPIPLPPIPLPFRATSGRYRSPLTGFQLELRVDVDGRQPLMKLSGDYFTVSGGTVTYFGSWTVDAVTTSTVNGSMVVVGTARTTWPTTFTVARVVVPRRTVLQPAAAATITWSTLTGAPGATYVCQHESGALRTVELEQDVEDGVTRFDSYNTGSLPSGGPARQLNVAAAYGEAGIQILDTGGTNVVRTSPTHIWNDASLHDAMLTHFSRYAERPQFKVWLLHAREHELTSTENVIGIMFDQKGLQRQGCASFYETIQSAAAADQRTQLYVNVHELGHCFNLFHSFHKSFMNPPLPDRPGALSWMNYPKRFNPGGSAPSGEAAFWGAFDFGFDGLELAHIRHGFRNNVIMGGSPFGTGAALEAPIQPAEAVSDTSGLQLSIRTSPDRPTLGTPIVLEIALTVQRGQLVHRASQLHPSFGQVQVTVSRPSGDTVVHRPAVLHCAASELHDAAAGEVLPVSAYIGYDAGVGQLFEDPGAYRIRASYTAPDGSVVVSNTALLRVWSPAGDDSAVVADLMLRDETGMALTLLGSDSPYLRRGMDALQEVVEEHADHRDAVYAQLAIGMNAARPFTKLHADGSVEERPPDLSRADRFLNQAIDASRGTGGLDDLTVYQVMAYLAASHAAAGDADRARRLRQDATELARSKNAPSTIQRMLRGNSDS
ncbi:hypothetical protein [Geodermatophilus obscurus]|uniref:hypothetical protein n=1 Tax=Geodermatophilus obscurus TaxID=1861 RepID=UPI00140FC5F1|nr:hypothetical protein [Geodermatophilus obscurus]